MNIFILLNFVLLSISLHAQVCHVSGFIKSDGKAISFASVGITEIGKGTTSNEKGWFEITNIPLGQYTLQVNAVGFISYKKIIKLNVIGENKLNIELIASTNELNEVVITGSMKEVMRAESTVPVEIITPKLFQKNPTPTLFEAIGMVNGVQPQLNCAVCNTGDIHINGMEGPYTMILIDGMPIVSSLSTVYGLSGIPNTIVDRIEVVKGPASSLYGSEAMGGIINVITKNPSRADRLSIDLMGTSWNEYNADVSSGFSYKKLRGIVGVNYFNYQTPYDKNNDGFTDVTLQNRMAVFNKWNIQRAEDRVASLAARYVYEDRWGGQTQWNKSYRGGTDVYGESIYTKRYEVIGMYQLPTKHKIMSQVSYNWHNQNSFYGNTPYMANQQVAFAQLYLDKKIGTRNSLLLGTSYRYTYYDDNTPGTASADSVNQPMNTHLPGLFVQDEIDITSKQKLLLGYRYDYHKQHGNIHSPRLAYKYSLNQNNVFRVSVGTGFRVVNLFTEDHAALSGAREVIIKNNLNPERSFNSNFNYVFKRAINKYFLSLDATVFYSRFSNKIVGDFDTDPQKIIYDNLNGYAVSQGISTNLDVSFPIPLKVSLGVSYMDVFLMEDEETLTFTRQIQAPKWSGNGVISYIFKKGFTVDVTSKWYGPMRLPVFPNDYRPDYSPWFNLLNVQVTKRFNKGITVYGGVKNALNFVPKNPIMRPFDPFDRHADNIQTNPNGYTFDPSYNYASLQGIRLFLGVRYVLGR